MLADLAGATAEMGYALGGLILVGLLLMYPTKEQVVKPAQPFEEWLFREKAGAVLIGVALALFALRGCANPSGTPQCVIDSERYGIDACDTGEPNPLLR